MYLYNTYLGAEGRSVWPSRRLAFAPGGDDDAAARLEHARHLLHVPLLVGHVLARLAGPDLQKVRISSVAVSIFLALSPSLCIYMCI